jgi:hypothetical protein
MHQIEPFYLWRDYYKASEDRNSPVYQKEYSELYFSNKIYNFLIHPQWDSFGSETLYYKQLYVDYDAHFCVIEFIGEWNDLLDNDIMFLKTEVINPLIDCGIDNFILIMENVLNFHANESDYYEEWNDEIEGSIFFINALDHVLEEMNSAGINHYSFMDSAYNDIDWRIQKPYNLLDFIENKLRQYES